MKTKRGFTLVEVLIVIAIIIVLAGLLFSFTKRGIEAAQSAKCIGNIKQLCSAQMSVAGDYGGYLVHASWTPMPINTERKAVYALHFAAPMFSEIDPKRRGQINQRIQAVGMLNCPAAYTSKKSEMVEKTGHAGWRTYALNTRVGYAPQQTKGQGTGAAIDGVTRFDQIEDATLLILVSEAKWNDSNNVYRAAFGPGTAKTVGMAGHHRGGFHVGYADGHVERHTAATFPAQGKKMPDGRTVRLRTGNNRTKTDEYFSMVWRGYRGRRDIPDP